MLQALTVQHEVTYLVCNRVVELSKQLILPVERSRPWRRFVLATVGFVFLHLPLRVDKLTKTDKYVVRTRSANCKKKIAVYVQNICVLRTMDCVLEIVQPSEPYYGMHIIKYMYVDKIVNLH